LTQQGTVAAIVDSSTIDVRLPGSKSERVQLFGVSALADGSCALSQAQADITSLALGKSVWLVAVGGKPGRNHALVVAYVVLPGGLDLGLELVRRGDVTVRTDAKPFKQRHSYLRVQAAAESGSLGLWGCNGSTPATPHAPPVSAVPPGQSQDHGHQGQANGQANGETNGQANGQANGQGNGAHGH
jgi:endonuclease YncB( thermonuclease family)